MSAAFSMTLALTRESERINWKQFTEITGLPYIAFTNFESVMTVPPTEGQQN
jgi:hypothetical protein